MDADPRGVACLEALVFAVFLAVGLLVIFGAFATAPGYGMP